MLRIHFVQWCYHLSNHGRQDRLYEVESERQYAGLRLLGSLPDETRNLNFRHPRAEPE